jgi:hypothetical protein
MKRMLRRLVLSQTYRQSTTWLEAAATLDPTGSLLWRHPGHRLDAETIRDAALSVSGLLNPKIGGPSVFPWQPDGFWRDTAGESLNDYKLSTGGDEYRRGIYTIWRRGAHYPAFAVFDAPDRATCTLQRSRSSTALQALNLMNDKALFEMANRLADRVTKEFTGSIDERLELAFRTVLTRRPSAAEQKELRAIYDRAFAATKRDRAGYFDAVHVLMNLHEAIHRG